MIMHGDKPVDTIFIHCAATRPEWMRDAPLHAKVAEIARWHRERGWTTIGYHWVIDRDGQIAPGRPEDMVGAHVASYNRGSIGICLLGGHGANVSDEFSKNFTDAQNRALRSLIADIKRRANIKYIRGHSEVADKACPGFNVARWLAREPAKPAIVESTTVQASAVQLASGAAGAVTAVGVLDGKAQIFALALSAIVAVAAAWIMRERIRRWVRETSE